MIHPVSIAMAISLKLFSDVDDRMNDFAEAVLSMSKKEIDARYQECLTEISKSVAEMPEDEHHTYLMLAYAHTTLALNALWTPDMDVGMDQLLKSAATAIYSAAHGFVDKGLLSWFNLNYEDLPLQLREKDDMLDGVMRHGKWVPLAT